MGRAAVEGCDAVGIAVVLADGAAAWRRHARRVLEEQDLAVVGEAATAAGTVDLVLALRPDVLLLDLRMQGGLTVVLDLGVRAPDVATVVVTAPCEDDDADVVAALRAGASGFVHKSADPAALVRSVRAVLAGQIALPRSLVAPLVRELRRTDTGRTRREGPTASLTTREWEVLDLLRQGYGTTDIATLLFVSPVTVRTHLAAVQRKLKVGSRAAALQLLADAGARPRTR